MRLLIALCALGCLAAAERLVTTTADDGPGSLRQALSGGGKVAVAFAPQLAGRTIALTRPIAVQGDAVIDAGGARVEISGGGRTRLFTLCIDHGSWSEPVTVAMRGLILSGGSARGGDDASGAGGAILVRAGSTLVLERCELRGNQAEHGGGAVRVAWRGTLRVSDCLFEGNDGSLGGVELGSGGIAIGSEGVLEVRRCIFRGNRGTNGGGIGSMLGRMTVEECLFEGNEAVARTGTTNHGGGIYTDGASAKIDDEIGDLLAVRRCRFIGNRAARQGGGAFLWGYKLDRIEVESCWFEGNAATGAGGEDGLGGALRIGNADWRLAGSAFDRNTALRQGGGLWIGGAGAGVIEDCVLSGCRAGDDPSRNTSQGGGIMAVGSGRLAVRRTTFADCVSHGGGVVFGSQPVELAACLFVGNQAGNGQLLQGVVVGDGGGNLAIGRDAPAGLPTARANAHLAPFAVPPGGTVPWRLPVPALAAGARAPDPPAPARAKREPAAVVPPPAPPQARPEAQAGFAAALRASLERRIGARGRGPAFSLRNGRTALPARIEGLSGDDLELRVGEESSTTAMTTSWSKLSTADRASLAVALAGDAADADGHALAAYWSLAAGDVAGGLRSLELAGRQADSVRSAFSWQTR